MSQSALIITIINIVSYLILTLCNFLLTRPEEISYIVLITHVGEILPLPDTVFTLEVPSIREVDYMRKLLPIEDTIYWAKKIKTGKTGTVGIIFSDGGYNWCVKNTYKQRYHFFNNNALRMGYGLFRILISNF